MFACSSCPCGVEKKSCKERIGSLHGKRLQAIEEGGARTNLLRCDPGLRRVDELAQVLALVLGPPGRGPERRRVAVHLVRVSGCARAAAHVARAGRVVMRAAVRLTIASAHDKIPAAGGRPCRGRPNWRPRGPRAQARHGPDTRTVLYWRIRVPKYSSTIIF